VFDLFLKRTSELLAKGEPFATATVVRYAAPISGKPGNKAVISSDGKLWGWIGGGCSQPVVIKEALKALADGQPRLIRITPSAAPEEGIVDYTMTCHSGGTLDIFIEPVLPRPQIVILGRSPVAQTLCRLAKAIHYSVSVAAEGADGENFPDADSVHPNLSLNQVKITPQTFLVVSTQGEDDEGALELALQSGCSYIAFVASKIKAQKVLDYLRGRGIEPERLSQVRAPAGLDIRAASPEEIAVSIVAEIIQAKGVRAKTQTAAKPATLSVFTQEARDPICGMAVNVASARHKSEYQGSTFYFCCAGCKQTFDKQPAKYTTITAR
jgi:xanthine dehydrogenase accessory factor